MMRLVATVALTVSLLAGTPAVQARQGVPDRDTQLTFLKTARIVDARPIGKGSTGALRLTLSDGALTHDASFQPINQEVKALDMPDALRPKGELVFVDSYRYNIAAWGVAQALGLDHMMPPTVERMHNGRRGALSWWLDEVVMDEATREASGPAPEPEAARAGTLQRQTMRVFAELVQDTDRNKGNILYTTDWRLVMVDFTRAFRRAQRCNPASLNLCNRRLLTALRTLSREAVETAAGRHLSPYEINALMKRRDLLVAHFDRLVAERGEAAVLF
jgi:hypothetical protein